MKGISPTISSFTPARHQPKGRLVHGVANLGRHIGAATFEAIDGVTLVVAARDGSITLSSGQEKSRLIIVPSSR